MAVAVVAATQLLVPVGSRGAVPPPLYALAVVVLTGLLWGQRSALRLAEGGTEVESSTSTQSSKWGAAIVSGFALLLVAALVAMLLVAQGGAPSTVTVEGDRLVMTMRGPYKFLALRSRVEVPLEHVVAIRADPQVASLPRGTRFGTSTPGAIAGRFTTSDCRAFWAMNNGSDAVVIDLWGGIADFDRLVAEVEDPAAVVRTIRDASLAVELGGRGPCDL